MAEKLFDDKFFNKLDSMSLRFTTAINNLYSGGRRSKMHGSTVEFANFREYIQGDDFRRIDWNAYGRFEKFFIKLFLDEKQLTTNIFVDMSGSMDFGNQTKARMALKIAAAFAYLSAQATDRVSITGLSDGKTFEICPQMAGKASFYRSVEKMENISPGGETRLGESLRGFKGLSGNTGASIIITDLMTGEDYTEALKYLLFKKQQVVLVHVLSREEMEPQMSGRLRLTDSENGSYCDIDANSKTLETYQKALKAYLEEIKGFCLKTGIYYLPAVSDEDVETVMLERGTAVGVIG